MIHRFGLLTHDVVPIAAGLDNRDEAQMANPLYQVDDKEAPDISTAYKIAEEMINVNGANVILYARTENEDVDDVFDEDPDPTYWNPTPLKAFFTPQPLERELTKWGADAADNKTEIVFLRSHIFKEFGDRLLRPGDLIEVPYNSMSRTKPKYYQVDTAPETGMYRYQWLYITCKTTLLMGDPNIRPHTEPEVPYVD